MCGLICPKSCGTVAQSKAGILRILDHQGVLNSKKTVVFDFAAQKTIQAYLEKLMWKELTGLYTALISRSCEKFPVEDYIYGDEKRGPIGRTFMTAV